MRLKEIIWESSPENPAVQSGRIDGEYVALVQPVGKRWQYCAGNGLFIGDDQYLDAKDEAEAKLKAKLAFQRLIEQFCIGSFIQDRMKDADADSCKQKACEFHVSCMIGDPDIGAVKQGRDFFAPDMADAAAQFIRTFFKTGDGSPFPLLQIDKLRIERK